MAPRPLKKRPPLLYSLLLMVLRDLAGMPVKLHVQDTMQPGNPNKATACPQISRHRVNGVGRGGGQTVFNQILTRFHGIRLKSG